jgi:hypothetical protein
MFQRTFTTLGQAVGWRKPQTDDESLSHVEVERRIWVRYPCDLDATCQPANKPDAMRLSARVRNVSRGGIQFSLNCPVESGSLLSVELPGIEGKTVSTVLAYVVRVEPTSGGEWNVGCTFASELTKNDLDPFGVQRLVPRDNDQRSWVRFPCDVSATFEFVKEVERKTRAAQVANLSANGIGLVASEPIDLGKLLNLELRAENRDYKLSILACVVRLTARPDGQYTVGCNLIRELNQSELDGLLGSL